jgi:hypothetical protein
MKRMLMSLAVFCFAVSSLSAATIELNGGGGDVPALLRIAVPAKMLEARPGQVVTLTDEKGREVQAQVELAGLGGEQIELVLVRPAGLGRTLKVGAAAAPQGDSQYATAKEGDRKLVIYQLLKSTPTVAAYSPMAAYHIGVREMPAHPEYNRANFFHPLFTPAGVIVTDDAPPDHLHHRGLFMSFTEVTWRGGGKRLSGNFWHAAGATIEPGKLYYDHGGAVAATMAASHDFRIGKQTVLVQDVIARAARLSERVNALDVEYRLTAKDGDVVLGPNFYSCLQLRGAAKFNRPEMTFNYTDGKQHRDVNLRDDPPREEPPFESWIDETGLVDGRPAGAAVVVHPSTPKSRMCYSRQVKGLNLDFLYDGPLKIKAGETIVAHYQVYVHDGTVTEAKVGQIAEWFNPGVQVKWVEK